VHYTTLGRTGPKVSVAWLGTGGFSRMGLKFGLSEDETAPPGDFDTAPTRP
jgi:hypothetical protein